MRFLILLLVFVYIEVSLAGLVVEQIGLLNTIGLMILSAFLGVFLIRRQGFLALENIRLSLAQGKTPTDDIVGGLFLIVAGFLFIFPGFFSDILGFFLLLPWLRRAVIAFVKPRLGSSGAWFSRTVVYTKDGGWQSSQTWSKPTDSRDSTLRAEDAQTFESNPSQVIIDCTPEDPAAPGSDQTNGQDKGQANDMGKGGSDGSNPETYDTAAHNVSTEDAEKPGDDNANGTEKGSRSYDSNPKS